MSRHRRLAALASLVAMVAGLTLVLAPAGVSAAPGTRIVDDGWWWRLQAGVLAELPPPPNVGEDELLVQATPEGAQAIAAVSAELEDGAANPVLTLDVTQDGGGEVAVILACQAGAAWTGTHAGRWDSKPPADCTTSVTGLRSEDGTQWTFAIGSLQFNDKVNVILVPGVLADSESPPTFSLVFAAPTNDSIATVPGQAPPATVPPTSPPPTAPPAPPASAPTPTAAPPPTVAAPVVPAAPALEPEDQGITATAPVINEATTPVPVASAPLDDVTEPRTLARIVGLLVLLAGIAGGVLAMRTQLLALPAATPATPVEGGLARFRTERTSEPTSVS